MISRNKHLRFTRSPFLIRAFLPLLIVVALFAPMNFVLITPGPATPLFPKVLTVDETSGVKSYAVKGQLNLLTIYVTNPESYVFGAEILGCWAWGECAVMPRSVIYEKDATNEVERASGKKDMVKSQNIALAAAKGAIARNFPGVNVDAVKDSDIKVSLKNTGGPSGGLIFTLGMVDLLTSEDLLQGRAIAGTGTITVEGKIGPIGGVTEKIIGAKRADASLLFISAQNCADLPEVIEGIEVVAVESIDQAISYLREPLKKGLSGAQNFDSERIRGCASVGA